MRVWGQWQDKWRGQYQFQSQERLSLWPGMAQVLPLASELLALRGDMNRRKEEGGFGGWPNDNGSRTRDHDDCICLHILNNSVVTPQKREARFAGCFSLWVCVGMRCQKLWSAFVRALSHAWTTKFANIATKTEAQKMYQGQNVNFWDMSTSRRSSCFMHKG